MKHYDFEIRSATSDDIALIGNMAEVVFRETYRNILSPEQMEYMMEWMYSAHSLEKQMDILGHKYFIASVEGRSAGYMSLNREKPLPDGTELFHLQKIYVMPDFQKNGLGRLLIDKAIDYVKTLSSAPCRIELNVNRNNPAVGFYMNMGFRKVRQGDFYIGNGFYMNDYIMAVEILP
ncbi:MAG: GNAT family N-acetyltransferase [Bacteroidaceae bacterium]|nr:GNAT family N-acetyltransferase [Bacteroidaceae bacterium]